MGKAVDSRLHFRQRGRRIVISFLEFSSTPQEEMLPAELLDHEEPAAPMAKKFSICGTFIIRTPDGNCGKTIHANIKVDSLENLEAALKYLAEMAAQKAYAEAAKN